MKTQNLILLSDLHIAQPQTKGYFTKGTFIVVPHLYLDINLSRYTQAKIKAPMKVIRDLNDKTVPAHGLGGSTRKCQQFSLKESGRVNTSPITMLGSEQIPARYSKMCTPSAGNCSLLRG